MAIMVNGNEVDWVQQETVSQLLQRVRYIFPMVIVKVNDQIVKRSDFENHIIPNSANVDVIHLMSGG
jgi:thiamine biosynthesis protein ThiS